MEKQSLASIFDAMYHGKYDYNDFLTSAASSHYKLNNHTARQTYHVDSALKAYHKFLNLFVFDFLLVNNNSVYSYRKGVNVINAVQPHSKSRHFFQTDIRNFFGSIKVDLIRKVILSGYESIPISDIAQHYERIVELVCIDGALPAGFSTSPIISNSCLYDFDNAFEKFCKNHNLVYSRYSDDIIVSSAERKLFGIDAVIEGLLRDSYGDTFKLNESKSKYTSIGGKIKLLGMVILPNGSITIDSKIKSRIEVLLHFFSSDRAKFLNTLGEDLTTATSKMSGHLNYINTTDPAYLDKLRKKYGTSVIDMFIRGSVK